MGSVARKIAWLRTAAGAMLLLAAGAAVGQTVPPGAPAATDGGPLGTAAQPGVRPPRSQSRPGEALPGGRAAPPGLPQAIRWTEDWSKPAVAGAPLLDKIKHIPLGRDDIYLTLGGQVRVYYTDTHHSVLGLRPGDSNDPVQSKLRLLADLHVGPNVRAFVELGDNREYGERFATPPNRGKIDIAQAFVDLTLPLGDAGRITLRPGRFEMPLGNGKLVAVREGLNQRYTYQGVRGTYILPGLVSVDVFATRPVNLKPGPFDDGPDHTRTFNGVYVSSAKGVFGIGTDAYWYRVDRDRATLRQGVGVDHRDNWGARLWKRTATWDLDLEGDYQTGRFIDRDIRAWGILLDTGYTFADAAMKPRLGLRANAFSGDRDPRDGTARTFVPAFPRLPVISEAAFFTFSNLVDAFPSLTVKPRDDVTVLAGPDFLMRQTKGDGVYVGPANASLAPYASSRFIGTDLNIEASWQPTKRLQLRLFETYFLASGSLERDGGRNGNYLGLQSDYRF